MVEKTPPQDAHERRVRDAVWVVKEGVRGRARSVRGGGRERAGTRVDGNAERVVGQVTKGGKLESIP